MNERKYRVLIAKPGLDGHDRGAKVIARALRDAGFEVIYTGLRQTPEMIAEAALQEDVDAVGLSILSGAHMALAPRVIELLKANGLIDVPLFLGGIVPDDDIPALKEMGVYAVFGPGASMQDIVASIRGAVRELAAVDFVERLLSGDRRALARLITHIENDPASASEALAILFPHTGRAHLVGVTGAPGTGKSSLVNQMALGLRRRGRTVAILAIDPTSPFSGGAILGDRIRMRDLSGDPGVFIRSMASRGSLGGLSRAAGDTIKALDAAGFDVVLIETVGAGQAEVEIARYAQTVIVVEAPGMGDDVQAIKAGILEIADVLVVNKSDDPRARNTVGALRQMLQLTHPGDSPRTMQHHGRIMEIALPEAQGDDRADPAWEVPIHQTTAITGEGVEALLDALDAHRAYLDRSGGLERRERARLAAELDRLLRDALLERLLGDLDEAQVTGLIDRIAARELDPHAAVRALLG